MIHENLTEFKGRPVVDWEAGADKPPRLDAVAVRVRIDWDESEEGITLAGKLAELTTADGVGRLEALVIGAWQGDDTSTGVGDILEAIVSARGRLAGLRHLFVGDIVGEECEVSWIVQADYGPLLAAYPTLETLVVRGGEGLTFGAISHENLRELTLQAGGLPASVVREVAAAKLPALEHLELWLGTQGYGGDATLDDLAPFLRGDRFPKLKYLGLKNSEFSDDIAAAVAIAPVLDQVETLDLSLGTLGDAGVKALLDSPGVRKLKRLDLRHHYLTDATLAAVQQLGIEVEAGEAEDDDGGDPSDRFVAVSE